MATLTFTADLAICAESNLITWRAHDPPTRLSDDVGGPVYPQLVAMDVVDNVDPDITCPEDVTIECDESTDPSDTGSPGHFQGFEDSGFVSNTYPDWNDSNSSVSRVASGTGGVTSKSGSAHAVIDSTSLPPAPDDYTGAYSRLGGYDSTFGGGFSISLDVYMDLSDPAVTGNTYGWDLSTAASTQAGGHRRDFIFHTASDASGDILVGGSNNTNFTRRNDIETINHHHITSTGWYTFEWVFRDFGDGTLAVDLNLLDASGTWLWTETRNNPTDLIATVVGGHRYTWFTFLEVDTLAIDNTTVSNSTQATDNCDPAPVITSSDSFAPACGTTGVITRTWQAEDHCGNISTCDQIITVVDTTDPVVTAPNDTELECSTDLPAAATTIAEFLALAGADADDNCTDQGDLTVSSVTGLLVGTECSGTITRTYTIEDECSNSSNVDHVFNVSDETDPVIDPCPADISVNADAGGCDAVVTWTDPTATDNCDPSPTVVCSPPSGSPFPQGTTPVTCTATDDCDNTDVCSFDVIVSGDNEMLVDLDLEWSFDGSRCITFELWDCPDTIPTEIVEVELTFVGGSFSGPVLVPCGVYDCITARDTLHTLRRTDEGFGIVGTQYVADFTVDDKLIGGNLNDDFWIDILDFGVFSSEYGEDYVTGDTTCATPFPHADISGNGSVFTEDFTFIQINFLEGHEPNCCGQPGLPDGAEGPITSIPVDELIKRGLGHLAAGDLNDDGMLNEEDIVAFMMGARPHKSAVLGTRK
jgi:hypothetical protein